MPHSRCRSIAERFAEAIVGAFSDDKHPRVDIQTKYWRRLAETLHDDDQLAFDWVGCLSAVDYVADDRVAVVYDLYSTRHDHWFAVKVYMDRESPRIASVMDLWPAADWHEREAYDMMGVKFTGPPNLTRILMWEGYPHFPLRKDFPLEGKPPAAPDVAFSEPAPMDGGPFVTVAGGEDTIAREPRSRNPEDLQN